MWQSVHYLAVRFTHCYRLKVEYRRLYARIGVIPIERFKTSFEHIKRLFLFYFISTTKSINKGAVYLEKTKLEELFENYTEEPHAEKEPAFEWDEPVGKEII